jgi:rubrerythrin
MGKQSRKPWTAEARARHKAGVVRYQKERARNEFWHKVFDELKDYAGRNNYDLESTVNAFWDTVRNFEQVIKDKRLQKTDFRNYFHKLIRQRQVEQKRFKAA